MEALEIIDPYLVRVLIRQLCNEGPAILTSDKRNKDGFIAFKFCYYRKFQLLSDEEKEQYVWGQYRLLAKGPQLMSNIPDNIDEDDDDAMLQFYSQHTQTLTSVQRATTFQNNFVDDHRRLCHI